MSVAAKTREATASVTREHKFLSEYPGDLWVKEFKRDVMSPVPRKSKCGYQRKKERLQSIAEGTSSAPRLTNSSPALFFERNECPRTHCSLVVKEGTKDSSRQRD